MTSKKRLFDWLTVVSALALIGFVIGHQVERSEPRATKLTTLGQMYWVPKDGRETTTRMVERGVGRALDSSDLIFVQVPWALGFDSIERARWLSELAREHGKQLGIGLDWLNQDRTDFVNVGLRAWQFSEEITALAFENDVWKIVEEYQPDYLSLGIEVDFLARRSPREFSAFVRIYSRIYERIKAEFPQMNVLVTFQYDSILRDSTAMQLLSNYGAVEAFGDQIDILGLSVYPCQSYNKASDISSNYFSKARDIKKRVGIFETAWPGSAGERDKQSAYLLWLFEEASRSAFDVLIWTSSSDIAVPTHQSNPIRSVACAGSVTDWYVHLGLWDTNGEMKPAANIWKDQISRNRLISLSQGEAIRDQKHQSSKPGY